MTNYIQKNMDSSFYNLMVMFFEERNYELADEYYKKAKPYISQKERSAALEILTDTLVLSLTEGLGAQDQIVILDDLIANGQLEVAQIKRAQLYLENAWLSILNECMNAGAYEEGYKRSGVALQDLPQSSKLKKTQKMFYDNCITDIHNNFARTANAGDYDGARTILEEGLQKFPDDKTLKSDLVLLNKRTSN
jgi:tetratricopeptide (TPR) repeat protein